MGPVCPAPKRGHGGHGAVCPAPKRDHEDHCTSRLTQAWMSRLGLPYRGQRLAGEASEVFTFSRPAAICLDLSKLSEQDHQCKVCAAPSPQPRASWTTSFLHQSFAAHAQNLQALCLECHGNKTALEQAGPDLPENRRGPVPQEHAGSRHPSSVPRTTWSKLARGTWPDLTYVKLGSGRFAARPG